MDKYIYILQMYTFASVDLTLFVATHPNHKEALDTLKIINQERKKICDYIEAKYSAICSKSIILDGFFKKSLTESEVNVGI